MIVPCQLHQRPYRELMNPFFISTINLAFTMKYIGNLLLCFVRINSEVFQSLKYHNPHP